MRRNPLADGGRIGFNNDFVRYKTKKFNLSYLKISKEN